MKRLAPAGAPAFTLLEVMLALTIFAGVLAAVYSTWSAILRSSKVGLTAAADAQRSRIAVRALEEALLSTQFFGENAPYYSFVADTSGGDYAFLSLVARLPRSFPRSGNFGDAVVRRVSFSVEPDSAGVPCLLLRQNPVLFEPNEEEEVNPLVLARHVELFLLEFWGPRSREWEVEWPYTNQLPRLIRFGLALSASGQSTLTKDAVITRVVTLPGPGVPRGMQVAAGPGAGAPRGGANLRTNQIPGRLDLGPGPSRRWGGGNRPTQ